MKHQTFLVLLMLLVAMSGISTGDHHDDTNLDPRSPQDAIWTLGGKGDSCKKSEDCMDDLVCKKKKCADE